MEDTYVASQFGKKEEKMMNKFNLQLDDARSYFLACIKPRLDRAYKLYIAYNGDRAKEIKKWQANVFVPYIHAVIETLKPRILDARPEFTVQGRTENDQAKAAKLQQLLDYSWEMSNMDAVSEMIAHSAMVYGIGYMQVSWKKEIKTGKFLVTNDITEKKKKWEKRTKIIYDAPYCEWVDNYNLWYDWHNINREHKQFWFKRLILSGSTIKLKYPAADKRRLRMAFNSSGGDLTEYSAVRNETKLVHEKIVKGADSNTSFESMASSKYQNQSDEDLKMYEVFEWIRPFDDEYAVIVNGVPILRGASMPIPYDFKETPFIEIPYLRLPGEYEGCGIPLILENANIMLNMIKNQRLDSATLNIHKMWIVNPLANVDKRELIARPFGIIYTTDTNGVREVQFSDIKASAYREEELLKGDMRYASGVDDFSMGAGTNGTSSATEVRHLRESTLERVRLFVNHIGDGYSKLARLWISMYRQFFTDEMVIRIVGEDGKEEFPIIQKDDLCGNFDFKASVLPSIAGQNDIKKKQDMDLFQLLISLPFIDPRKLTSKVLHDWNWSLDTIAATENNPQQSLEEKQNQSNIEQPSLMFPENQLMAGKMLGEKNLKVNNFSPQTAQSILQILGGNSTTEQSPFSQASRPINLLTSGGAPTAPPIQGPTENPRGFNRGGQVNTNIPLRDNSNPEATLARRALSIQSKNNG